MGFPCGVITYKSEITANFERTDAFSVETWFYQTANKTTAIAQHMLDADENRTGWLCNVWTLRMAGVVLCAHEGSGNLIHVRTTSLNQYAINTWNHIVFTYNGNSLASGVKIYINGTSRTLTTIVNNLTGSIQNRNSLWLGDSYTYPYFPGRLDEFVIYPRELPSAEVTYRYNSGNGRENLMGPAYLRYNLNQSSGLFVPDTAGGEKVYNGKTINNPIWVPGKLNNCIQLNGVDQRIEA
jgi:hypothetical protein